MDQHCAGGQAAKQADAERPNDQAASESSDEDDIGRSGAFQGRPRQQQQQLQAEAGGTRKSKQPFQGQQQKASAAANGQDTGQQHQPQAGYEAKQQRHVIVSESMSKPVQQQPVATGNLTERQKLSPNAQGIQHELPESTHQRPHFVNASSKRDQQAAAADYSSRPSKKHKKVSGRIPAADSNSKPESS